MASYKLKTNATKDKAFAAHCNVTKKGYMQHAVNNMARKAVMALIEDHSDLDPKMMTEAEVKSFIGGVEVEDTGKAALTTGAISVTVSVEKRTALLYIHSSDKGIQEALQAIWDNKTSRCIDRICEHFSKKNHRKMASEEKASTIAGLSFQVPSEARQYKHLKDRLA